MSSDAESVSRTRQDDAQHDPHLPRIIKCAVVSRCSVWLLGFLAQALLGQFDAGERTLDDLSHRPRASFLDLLAWKLLGMFTHWDGFYFSTIAAQGYADVDNPELLEAYAFFPLYPALIRSVAEMLSVLSLRSFSIDAAVIAAGFVISNTCFVLAACQLYTLTATVLRSRTFAFRCALLFCVTPASVFMSAIYAESLWAFLTLSGMILFMKDEICSASLVFALCTATRSNGIILIGFPLFHSLQRLYWVILEYWASTGSHRSQAFGEMLRAWLKLLPCCAIIVAPYFVFNYYGYSKFCNSQLNTPVAFPAKKLCDEQLRFGMYHLVEQEFWNVGVFNYYELKQLPNFVLAAPMLLLSVSSIVAYIKADVKRFLTAGFTMERHLGWPPREKIRSFSGGQDGTSGDTADEVTAHLLSSRSLVFMWYWLVLTAISFVVLHIQVSTRFMSAVPPVYWFACWHIERSVWRDSPLPPNKPRASAGAPSRNSRASCGVLILFWCIAYAAMGTVLFCTFLPWT